MNFPGRISDDNGPEWNVVPHDLTDEKHIETLQAENKRLHEALERCRSLARKQQALQLQERSKEDDTVIPYQIELICNEVLKQ